MTEAITFSSLYVPNGALHVKGDFGPIDPDRLLILTSRLEKMKRWGRLGRLSLSAEEGGVSRIEDNKYKSAATERTTLSNQHHGIARLYHPTNAAVIMNTAEVRHRVETAVAETGMQRETAWTIMIDRTLRRGIRSAAVKNLGRNHTEGGWIDPTADLITGSMAYFCHMPLPVIWAMLYGNKLYHERNRGYKFSDRSHSLFPTYAWHADRMAVTGLLTATQRLVVRHQE